jgi:hypothetical protein
MFISSSFCHICNFKVALKGYNIRRLQWNENRAKTYGVDKRKNLLLKFQSALYVYKQGINAILTQVIQMLWLVSSIVSGMFHKNAIL